MNNIIRKAAGVSMMALGMALMCGLTQIIAPSMPIRGIAQMSASLTMAFAITTGGALVFINPLVKGVRPFDGGFAR